ncbi:hypothetical protein HYC85_022966 [Camellia sinensis]|uniref:Uncharacterized protein n=1 Tax=Camellia sinensis TaxID=4442 RepID=A0A7J7GDU2_CAMSI|nr:hypothetical protein HYC85_022966 [Camellia sinensis]
MLVATSAIVEVVLEKMVYGCMLIEECLKIFLILGSFEEDGLWMHVNQAKELAIYRGSVDKRIINFIGF